MTRYEAFISKDWQEAGIANVFVARRRDDGSADYGVFLVDPWCLGVKNAFGESDVMESDVQELIEEKLPDALRGPIHPTCAKKFLEGAIAYAETLGFAPHRDFRKARRVLSSLDATLCPTEFSYGRDGRPCYVPGEDDSEERVDRVLAILEARCGADGFDFEDPADDEDDEEILEVREDLIAWLDAQPEDVPRFYRFSGMVTALQICPTIVMPAKLMDALWGEETPIWGNLEKPEDFAAMMMQYWNYAGDLMWSAIAPDAPAGEQAIDIWMEDFPEETAGIAMAAAMVDWAGGFMHTTQLWPEAWGDALTRPDLAEHWEMVRWWAEFVGTGNKDRIADAAEADPPRNISLSVTAIARALKGAEPPV